MTTATLTHHQRSTPDLLTQLHPIVAVQHPITEFADRDMWAFREESRTDRSYWVAHVDDNIVGFAAFETTPEKDDAGLLEIWIHPDHHRNGYGRQLCERALTDHDGPVFAVVSSATDQIDEPAGCHFARAVGFAPSTVDTSHSFTGPLPKPTLKSLNRELTAQCPNTTIKTHTEPVPEKLWFQIALAFRALWDDNPPHPDEVGEGFMTECVEHLEQSMAGAEEAGLIPLVTTATDEADQLIGYSIVDLPQDNDQPVLLRGSLTAPGPLDAMESAMTTNVLRTIAVLFPGFDEHEVFVEGTLPAKEKLRETLTTLGFTTAVRRDYFARSTSSSSTTDSV